MSKTKSKIKVIPCSGIGKVSGLIAREAVLQVTDRLAPDTTETVCLAHLVTGDEAGREKVAGRPCITLDGCSALCAVKSVEHVGGIVKVQYRVVDEMRNHRGKDAGTGSELTEDGWQIVDAIAKTISGKAAELTQEENNNG